jgi:choline dehydrogenase
LKAIGIEYTDQTNVNNRVFVPCSDVICTAGVLATPVLLMQSGIGPADILEKFGIPKLFVQPNLGKYLTDHIGTTIRWNGNPAVWGGQAVGTDPSNGYLPGPDDKIRRKFQYFSSVVAPGSYSVSLYDLNIKSSGHVETTQALDTNGGLLGVKIVPNYYSDPFDEDIFNLCWIARRVADAIIAFDPTAVFTSPTTYPFPPNDKVLFPLLVSAGPPNNFASQAHYVGTCGMGNDPNIHCVDRDFLLRGTTNVRVCDASSMPLDVDNNCVVFPVQNDGNTSRGINVLTTVLIEKLLHQPKTNIHSLNEYRFFC